MIIVIGGTKGGIGKTTLAIQTATGLLRSGRRVWLVDGDRQGSALASATNRADRQDLPQLPAAHYPDGRVLRAQVLAQREQFDDVVIDVGGTDSASLRAALMVADVLVAPFRPRAYEVWALTDIAQLVAEAQAMGAGLQGVSVLNFSDPGLLAADNREAEDAAAELDELAYLGTPIGSRKALSAASSAGLHIDEASTKDPKASREIAAFMRALIALDPTRTTTKGS